MSAWCSMPGSRPPAGASPAPSDRPLAEACGAIRCVPILAGMSIESLGASKAVSGDAVQSSDLVQIGPRCPHDYQISCNNCRLNTICLPLALELHEVEQLDRIIQRGRPLQKGEHLYRQDEEFRSVYAVRSGSVKAYSITDGGQE